VSGARTQSDSASALVEGFLEFRESVREKRVGGGGLDLCRALTTRLDAALQGLASTLDSRGRFSLVAIGGYGRSELSIFSDVDVMLLYEEDDPSEAAAAIFRPLWAANLRLGHAVRTVREAADAARERFDTHTTLLTGRLVAGDQELFDRLTSEVASVTKARPLRRYLVAEERDRRLRSPYLLMATDVKAGRGGLRTLHGFEWERRREELIGRFSTESGPDEAVAREVLLKIRNALHATVGRAYDVFSPELREPASRWLDQDVYDTGEMLVGAMGTVDRLASRRWPEVLDTDDPVTRMTRKVWNRLRRRDGPPDGGPQPSVSDFTAILGSGEKGRLALATLQESGFLSDLLPEWEIVGTAPQLAPFHEHPVDAHLWRTIDEMQALISGENHHYRAIAAEVGSDDTLILAAFLHDIGKGQGGDHAALGADIARSFCRRLGRPPETSALVEHAVRHHLLLSQTATRRDLDDPAVIDEVAGVVGGLRPLQVLYLLTVADSKATGATMWNEWKAALVRTLFLRCATRFGADRPAYDEPGTTRQQVIDEAALARRPALEAHLDMMPDEYLRSVSPDDVLWHLDMIDQLLGSANIDTRSGRTAETAVVVGHGRPDFRRAVTQSLAANGIDVLEARMLGRDDGLIIDTFRVRDDRTGGSIAPDRWDRVRADVEAALSGGLDTESKVAARAAAYSSRAATGVEPKVSTSVDRASGDSVITIRCSDRIGRLAEILGVLYGCELEIRLAKLDSRSGEVIDNFHVRGDARLDDPVSLGILEQRIAASIEP
jgi:[protein-PII] uridylyltransferase